MRDIWKFIGGVAVGIMAVTGVYALEENEKPSPIEHDENEVDEVDDKVEDETDDEEVLIVRTL